MYAQNTDKIVFLYAQYDLFIFSLHFGHIMKCDLDMFPFEIQIFHLLFYFISPCP